jgi:murein DD-endopeptidase MepM/ murein hydrolase activator NlpD
MKKAGIIVLFAGMAVGIGLFYVLVKKPEGIRRSLNVVEWIRNPDQHADWSIKALSRCNNAPFLFPTNGYIGFLWDDSFRPVHRHQGVDIFGGTKPGVTPVYAVSDGYLTRLSDWKSSVIVRVPNDPLEPGKQIWVYYTHMADPTGKSFISAVFPAGTSEVEVKAGTLLGYQGNYSGTADNPVGVHLHFSIVKDDGQGNFLNELRFQNTLDPSFYLGVPLNAGKIVEGIPSCLPES